MASSKKVDLLFDTWPAENNAEQAIADIDYFG